MKTSIIIILSLISLNSYSATLSERSESVLQALQTKMGNGSEPQMAKNLIELDARKEVYSLQLMGRLFQDDFSVFKGMKKDFKELEDVLGQAQKWQKLLEQDDLPAEKIKKYTTNFNNEAKNVADLLTKWKKKDVIGDYHKDIAKLSINESESNKLIIKRIEDAVEGVLKKHFDFTYGETGLHELRRSVRWPAFGFIVFSDLYSIKEVDCPVSANDLITMGKKSSFFALKENPLAKVTLDYCSYVKLVGSVELLGKIKDKLERQEVLDDKVPAEIKTKVESIYDEIMTSSLNTL